MRLVACAALGDVHSKTGRCSQHTEDVYRTALAFAKKTPHGMMWGVKCLRSAAAAAAAGLLLIVAGGGSNCSKQVLHLRVENAEDLDGGDVYIDDLVRVGPGVQQAPPDAFAQKYGEALVLLGHSQGGLTKNVLRSEEKNENRDERHASTGRKRGRGKK